MYLDSPGAFVEVNPPLVVWLFLPILRLAALVGIPVTWAPAMLVAVEAAVGVGLSALILRSASRSLMPLTWIMAAIALWLPGNDLAQREHQVFILLLPVLAGLAVGPSISNAPKWLRMSAGMAAGLGCALKPYFAVAWMLLEIVLALCDRRPRQSIRVETIAGAVVILAYGLAVLAIEPGYLTLMRTWGPLYLRWNVPSLWHLLSAVYCITTVIVFLLVLPLRNSGEWGRAAFVFATSSLVFIVAVLLQRKGFDYHWLPSFAFGAIALGASLVALNGATWRAVPVVIWSALTLLMIIVRIDGGVELGKENRRLAGAYAAALDGDSDSRARGQLVVLSTNLGHEFPMVMMLGTTWPLRWPSLWALSTPSSHWCSLPSGPDGALEQRVRDDLWEDLRRAAPPTVIVAQLPGRSSSGPGCDTFVDHLSTEPRFREFFAAYDGRDTIPSARYGSFLVLHRRAERAALRSVGERTGKGFSVTRQPELTK